MTAAGPDREQDPPTRSRRGVIDQLWQHPWGRVFAIAATIATVSWAVRETAAVTLPLLEAIGQVLLPLAIGFTIAYVLNPLVDGLQRRRLPRLVAASVLYLLAVVGCVLAAMLAVPPVIDQSTQLVSRSFEATTFVDYDGDGRWSGGEPLVIPVAGELGIYGEDRDASGGIDPGEPRYTAGEVPIAVSPSLASQVVGWLDAQRSGMRRLVGRDLEPRAMRFLAFYRIETAELRGVLDAARELAVENRPLADWPEALRVDPQLLPALDLRWARSWPGTDEQALAAAAEQLDPAQRERWRRVVEWYGQLWALRHRQLGAIWDGSWSPELERPLALEQLPAVSRPLAAPVLHAEALSLQRAWRGFAASDEPIDGEATGFLLEQLHQAESDGVGYAAALLERLREGGDVGIAHRVAERLGVILARGVEQASDYLAERATALVTNVAGMLGLALDAVLVPIYAFFLTLAMPGIRRVVKRYLPAASREHSLRLMREIEQVVAAFFRGRLIVCVLCGLLVWGGFTLCGVPYPGLFGILIGLATAVPLSGLLFLIPACLLVVVDGGEDMAWRLGGAIAVYTVVQTLEMTVFTPTIMGHEVELHPLVLILALILCGKLLGILGLILAVPIAATVRILARDFALPRLRRMAELRSSGSLDPPPAAAPLGDEQGCAGGT